jgi:hypothetical protein
MAKGRKSAAKSGVQETATTAPPKAPPTAPTRPGKAGETSPSRQGLYWVIGCALIGNIIGFAIGSGWFEFSREVSPWRQDLGNRVRFTTFFQVVTFDEKVWQPWLDSFTQWAEDLEQTLEAEEYAQNPSHPRVFAVLREAVVREKGGYVHHDLGLLVPAPSGASRGLGMVRDNYQKCQKRCLPGTADEKLQWMKERAEAITKNETIPFPGGPIYRQEEVLLRIPLSFQMTRSVALDILSALVPAEVQRKSSLHELDDAALLVLLLAHERGVGRFSRWLPYIASLPSEPSCGYSQNLRPYILDALNALRDELGVEVQGWEGELIKAQHYANRIVDGLNKDYGAYIQNPHSKTASENIQWALCQVASRATAGSEKYGSLRLVPIVDMINHDSNAGGFIELTGKERIENGAFVDAVERDSGTFVVRSLRHGRRKPLKKGQELLANYNVPQ